VLNDAGREALLAILAAIEATSALDDATVYPWAALCPEATTPSPAPATAEVDAYPEIVRRAIAVVALTDPTTAASISRHRYRAQRRILSDVFAQHSAMIQSVSSWGSIGAEGEEAIRTLDAAIKLIEESYRSS
jgi:hypothetical protein